MESLTENILEYCQGDFIREYSRLTKQQNIHIYRSYIRAELEGMRNDPALFARIAEGCCREEELDAEAGRERVLDMLQTMLQFFSEDYDQLMRILSNRYTYSADCHRARAVSEEPGRRRPGECGARDPDSDGGDGYLGLEGGAA